MNSIYPKGGHAKSATGPHCRLNVIIGHMAPTLRKALQKHHWSCTMFLIIAALHRRMKGDCLLFGFGKIFRGIFMCLWITIDTAWTIVVGVVLGSPVGVCRVVLALLVITRYSGIKSMLSLWVPIRKLHEFKIWIFRQSSLQKKNSRVFKFELETYKCLPSSDSWDEK